MTLTSEKKITRARAALICDQPFFGALALRLNPVEDRSAETAWTDGRSLGYNPDYIQDLPMRQLIGLVAHEVMHLALCHHTRQGARDAHRWNMAGDYAINQVLLDTGFELPVGCVVDSAYCGKSAEVIYELLRDQKPGGNQPMPIGEVRPLPGRNSTSDLKMEEQAIRVAVAQAVQQAKAIGKDPGNGFERAVKEALYPKVAWRAVLREFMDTVVRSDYCWMRPNPRYVSQGVYLPGLNSKTIGTMVVAIDTSGSVTDTELEQFSAEVSALLEEFNATVEVVYADTKVRGHETYTQADLPVTLKLSGGGGTDFRPVFEWVDQSEVPSCLIYMTDLECTRYPDNVPDYPVLWVQTHGRSSLQRTPPFGQVIKMEHNT